MTRDSEMLDLGLVTISPHNNFRGPRGMVAQPELGRQALLVLTRAVRFVAGVAALAGLGGCGGNDPQESPASVVVALHERVAGGEFEQACELFTQEVLDAISQGGSDCQTALAAQYPADKREELHDVEVDEDMIEFNGDTATVPASAVAFDGEPSTGSDTQVVRREDKWWISVGP